MILDNYRKDHQLLRELSRAHGYVTYMRTTLVLELDPSRNFQPAQRRAVSEFLDEISDELNQRAPDKLPVKIRLLRKGKSRYPAKK